MSRLRFLVPALLVAAWGVPDLARAQTCSFSLGPTPLAFGSYNAASTAPTDSTGTLSYACTSAKARPVTIQLSAGGGAFSLRQMAFGADRLSYNLYSDAARTAIWGSDPAPPYAWVTSVPAGPTHGATLTIYGRVFAGQWVTPGVYSDTIAVTLNF